MKTPGHFKIGDDIVWDNDPSISITPHEGISSLRLKSGKVYEYSSLRFYFIPQKFTTKGFNATWTLTVFSPQIFDNALAMWEGELIEEDGDVFFNDSMDEHHTPDRYGVRLEYIREITRYGERQLISEIMTDFSDDT